ncbi:MAG: hypothetical protein HZA54_08495 [Planctomycetes bacterium]|nr:hypothetical protein [Planctomycetota bacterium]
MNIIAEIDATGPLTHLALIAGAAAGLLCAAGAGARLLALARLAPEDLAERFLFGLGAGLGAVSLAVLGLGLAGQVKHLPFAGLALLLAVAGAREAARAVRRGVGAATELLRAAPPPDRVSLLCGAAFVLVALLLSGAPPMEYDDLEYHLGAPKHYLETGAIGFWPTVVYAGFPLNSEMWTLLAMVLTGSAWQGALAGKALNVLLLVAAAGVTAAIGKRHLGPRSGLYAALFFLCSVKTGLYSLRNYVEPYLTLESLLALAAFLDWAGSGEAADPPRRRAALVRAALATGFAVGCKYPALLFLALPLGLGFLLTPVLSPAPVAGGGVGGGGGRAAAIRVGARAAVLYGALALLPALPWFARNLADTGNPGYPLLGSILQGPLWSAEQEARFHEAHRPRGTLAGCLAGLTDGALAPPYKLSLLWVAFLPLLLLARPWSPPLRALGAYAALGVALWYGFTHRIDRFLYPLLPVCSLLSAAGLESARGARELLRVVAILLLTFYTFLAFGRDLALAALPIALGAQPVTAALAENLPGFAALRDLQAEWDDGGRLLMVGEARTFYCGGPTLAATVFDRNPLVQALDAGRSPEELRALLAGLGVTHVYVGWTEIERLDPTYSFPWSGGRRPGFWSLGTGRTGHEAFRARTAGALEPVRDWHVWRPDAEGGGVIGWWAELYRVRR